MAQRTKTLFHIGIGRRTVDTAVNGNKIPDRNQRCDGNGKTEYEGVPIRPIGTARQSQIADTANKSRKDGKGYHPHCGVLPDPKVKDFEVRFLEKKITLK